MTHPLDEHLDAVVEKHHHVHRHHERHAHEAADRLAMMRERADADVMPRVGPQHRDDDEGGA